MLSVKRPFTTRCSELQYRVTAIADVVATTSKSQFGRSSTRRHSLTSAIEAYFAMKIQQQYVPLAISHATRTRRRPSSSSAQDGCSPCDDLNAHQDMAQTTVSSRRIGSTVSPLQEVSESRKKKVAGIINDALALIDESFFCMEHERRRVPDEDDLESYASNPNEDENGR
jgi:hypothetical protein